MPRWRWVWWRCCPPACGMLWSAAAGGVPRRGGSVSRVGFAMPSESGGQGVGAAGSGCPPARRRRHNREATLRGTARERGLQLCHVVAGHQGRGGGGGVGGYAPPPTLPPSPHPPPQGSAVKGVCGVQSGGAGRRTPAYWQCCHCFGVVRTPGWWGVGWGLVLGGGCWCVEGEVVPKRAWCSRGSRGGARKITAGVGVRGEGERRGFPLSDIARTVAEKNPASESGNSENDANANQPTPLPHKPSQNPNPECSWNGHQIFSVHCQWDLFVIGADHHST